MLLGRQKAAVVPGILVSISRSSLCIFGVVHRTKKSIFLTNAVCTEPLGGVGVNVLVDPELVRDTSVRRRQATVNGAPFLHQYPYEYRSWNPCTGIS